MRLISATVRNYRVHRETRVVFDPLRTLVGGANETGKSTFAEALHHGLFLKARVTGEVRQSMLPLRPAPAPEVEIDFEAGGRRYHLEKRFSGSSGTVQLTEAGGAAWRGDEAEIRLASLLGVGMLQRVSRERLREQWAHLWVWQGQGMEDPSLGASQEQDRLMQRLQEEGGAVVAQSDADSGIFRAVEERYLKFFTATGMPKAGSELKASLEERDAAEERLSQASQAHERLIEAIRGIEDASSELRRLVESDGLLRREREETAAARVRVNELEKEIILAGQALKLAEVPLSALEGANSRVAELTDEVARLQQALAPDETELGELHRRVSEEMAGFRAIEERSGAAAISKSEAERALEAARSWAAFFAAEEASRQLSGLERQVVGYEAKLGEFQREISSLPAVDAEALAGLQRITLELERADASLQAMASGVTVLESDGSVRIGGKAVETGGSVLLDEASEIEAGGRFRFMITPGGGNRLLEARANAVSVRERLRSRLDALGIDSLDAAGKVNERREHLLGELKGAEASLKALDPEGRLRDRCASAFRDMESARAAAERFETPSPPLDAAEARTLVEKMKGRLAEADAAEKAARESLGERTTSLQRLQKGLQTKTEDAQSRRQVFLDRNGELERLLIRHGGEAGLQEALLAARQERSRAAAALEALGKSLSELQPDELRESMQRCERAIERNHEAQRECRERAAGFRARLERDGSDDPAASLLSAARRAERAREHFAAVERRSRASRLLYDLYRQEQAEDARRFSRPLALKISGYLRTMFGPDLEASVTYGGQSFGDIRIQRGGGEAIGFGSLSGGMREQVSAAVRLSIAELLAEGYDGSLPVVFDDAFTNTDPDRVRLLQRMLDRAASNGLQIIILSCHPEAYAGLGATQHLLKRTAGEEADGSNGH
ncbi:AAA family ATPase [Chlorobium sp. N1]|uniref:AAA family ATPase n=1 Tax=Chlorobium sp. N1 TaxID=2491138 RepID=UPI00103CA8AE|nr:AAA family ATPase [Chlorobium sp. N1]TCD48343.1 hypothetical protein E0L29_00145 [Chlorobium sp. N1]